MKFCTAINCMDGRVQIPVHAYLQARFGAEYVDTITEPGPSLILAERKNEAAVRSILHRVNISVKKHASVGIAVVAHHDCAGNPAPREEQLEHLQKAVDWLCQRVTLPVIGLWVDEQWRVQEVIKPSSCSRAKTRVGEGTQFRSIDQEEWNEDDGTGQNRRDFAESH